MTTNTKKNTRLDVRPILAAGEEPFELIMQTAVEIPDGGTLELLAPFEPVPLYQVMKRSGFIAHGAVEEGGTWTVRFTRAELTAESTVGEVHERFSATASVFSSHEMDLCCGGHLSLAHVAEAHGVDLDAFIRELTEAIARG